MRYSELTHNLSRKIRGQQMAIKRIPEEHSFSKACRLFFTEVQIASLLRKKNGVSTVLDTPFLTSVQDVFHWVSGQLLVRDELWFKSVVPIQSFNNDRIDVLDSRNKSDCLARHPCG